MKKRSLKRQCQSVEHATAERTVPVSILGQFAFFGQHLGICVSRKRIGKNSKTLITLACISVIQLSGQFLHNGSVCLHYSTFNQRKAETALRNNCANEILLKKMDKCN